MKRNRLLSAAVLMATCVLPMTVLAQATSTDEGSATPKEAPPVFNNYFDIGARWQSERSAMYGRYNGSPDPGLYATGDFLLRYRDPWNSGGTTYFEAGAQNLSLSSTQPLPNSSGYVKGGHQGTYDLGLFFDRTDYIQSTTFHTIYGTGGALNGALPGGGTTGLTSANGQNNSAALKPFLSQMTVGTERTKIGGNGNYDFAPGWSISTNLSHEHKEGTKEQSLLFGSGKNANIQGYNGVNASFPGPFGAPACAAAPNNVNCAPARNQGDLVYFPEPVNYDTDRYLARLAYQDDRLQGSLAYVYSSFTDNTLSFNAHDPFPGFSTALIGGVGGSSASSGGNKLTSADTLASGAKVAAAYALPPSNSAHQIKGEVGYNLTPTTRINGTFSYTLELQDSAFAPMTLNGNSTSIPGLPANSLDGRVQTIFGNVAVTSHPIANLDLRASYTIDDRDNETQRQIIKFIENDKLSTSSSAWSTMFTTPYGFVNQTGHLEGSYRIIPQLKATAGFDYENRTRNFVESDHSKETREYGKLSSNLWGLGDATLSYTHSVRRADNFCGKCGWAALGSTENQTNLMSYNLASRTRDEIKATLSEQPMDNLSVGFVGKFYNNNYPNTIIGMTNTHNLEAGVDVAYQASNDINVHAFYNFEEIFFDQRGLAAPSSVPSATNPLWKAGTTNQVHTAGVEGTWQANDKLKVGATYNLSYGNTAYLIADGNGIGIITAGPGQNNTGANLATQLLYNIVPLTDVQSIVNTIGIHAEYALAQNMSLWVGYTFERFVSNDYLNAISSTAYGNGLLPGDATPSYAVHVVGVSLRYKW